METDSGGHPEKEGGYEPFELQPSLLDAVASLCPESEAEEIWRVVGPSLAEQAGDLLQEVRVGLLSHAGQPDPRSPTLWCASTGTLFPRQRFTWKYGES